jgi:hypothetical protein
VTVVPKDFTEGMKVHVSMDNEVTELEPSSASNVFTEKIRRNIFEISEPEIRISLSAGYTHQAELFGHSPHPEEQDYQYTVLDGSTIVCRE